MGRVLEELDSPVMIDKEGRTRENKDHKNMEEEEERIKTTQGRIDYVKVG